MGEEAKRLKGRDNAFCTGWEGGGVGPENQRGEMIEKAGGREKNEEQRIYSKGGKRGGGVVIKNEHDKEKKSKWARLGRNQNQKKKDTTPTRSPKSPGEKRERLKDDAVRGVKEEIAVARLVSVRSRALYLPSDHAIRQVGTMEAKVGTCCRTKRSLEKCALVRKTKKKKQPPKHKTQISRVMESHSFTVEGGRWTKKTPRGGSHRIKWVGERFGESKGKKSQMGKGHRCGQEEMIGPNLPKPTAKLGKGGRTIRVPKERLSAANSPISRGYPKRRRTRKTDSKEAQ